MAETAEAKRSQGRSPPFPFIDLERALRRLKEFAEHSRGHPVRVVSAVSAWGYNPKSSGGSQTVGALKAFGLIEDSGSGGDRKIQISELGRRLGRNPPSNIRIQLLQEAALKPRLVGEYWAVWGVQRPPDEECLWALTEERGFTQEAAAKFLQVYDATILYAELAGNDASPDPDEAFDDYADSDPNEGSRLQAETKSVHIRQNRPAIVANAGETLSPRRAGTEWTERLRDREGIEIVVDFSREPSQETYMYLRDYIDFKLGTLKPLARGSGPVGSSRETMDQERDQEG